MAITLQSISRGQAVRAPRILLYSSHGVGKSTFGAGADAPIFIQTEDGADELGVARFPLASQYQDLIDAIGALYNEEHDFRTVVVDTIDWADQLIWSAINAKNSAQDLAYGKGAVIAAEYWRGLLDGLNALRNDRGMAVVLLAHTQVKRFDSPEVEPFDRYMPKLQERSSQLIQEWCDAVLFANYKMFTTASDVGFNKKVTRGISTGERVMYTSERPAYLAKNRYNLPHELPLSWPALMQAMRGGVDAIAAATNPAAPAANTPAAEPAAEMEGA